MKYAVIGAGFGDEGKGLFTDYLCSTSKNPLVVRYSGGQQAGHTVYHNGIKHVFSNFGAGTLRGVPTFWMRHCTFDPVAVVAEYKVLVSQGIKPKLFIDKRCPVTTPYEISKNRSSDAIDHGTCGVGVGATFQREEDFHSMVVGDLLYDFVIHTKLQLMDEYYHNFGDNLDFSDFVEAIHFIRECKDIQFSDHSFLKIWEYSGDVIFEGSQGLLLDQNIGFFPHVTRSNTGTKNLLKYTPEVYYITRAYQTRHGNGPMSNEHIAHGIRNNPEETNVSNQYQGDFRRTLLDLDLLKYAIDRDRYVLNHTHLVITCLDQVADDYRMTHNGKIIKCATEKEFIDKILSEIEVCSVYLSRTPKSKNIERYSCMDE